MARRAYRFVAALTSASVLLGTMACTEERRTFSQETSGSTGGDDQGNMSVQGGSDPDAEAVVTRHAGEESSIGVVPEAPVAATGEPIKIGMINQEDTPLGSFPELRLGAQAAVDWINAELGGVGGRPIELVTCTTQFNPEQSKACAQEMVEEGVVAVAGGIDITSNGSIPVLEQNGIPYVGGIPVNLDEMQSPVSFQFSGGMAGAFVAFAQHAADEGASKVVIAYSNYPPIKVAADYGAASLRSLGVDDVVEIPFDVLTTDFLPVVTKAASEQPDAIFFAAADTGCAPVMKTAHDLGVEAQLYLVGACAAPSIAEEIGVDAVIGSIFNVEGPIEANVDTGLYQDAIAKYGDPALPAASAATVTFRSMMNLWMVLDAVGPDVTSESVIDELRAAVDHPSFTGHPFTCDGEQMPPMVAMCAPQQILAERTADGLEPITDWIDVPAIVAGLEIDSLEGGS